MPLYEYRCRTCDRQFELRRSMRDASAAARCPDGHDDTVRMLSMFATVGSAPGSEVPSMGGGGGGCCGGACGCGH